MNFLTLTANLLAETTYTFAEPVREGATQRAQTESFQLGGKGINVTRMLSRLGADTCALCFPGGATGVRCESWLRARGIPHRSFPTTGETRSGAVVRAPGADETTFLGAESRIEAAAIAACAGYLDTLPDGGFLAVCGSMPGWTAPEWDPLRATLERWARRSILVVDTYGPPLPWFAELPAALIKINRREFAAIARCAPEALDDSDMSPALAEASTSPAMRALRWIVTNGPRAVWFGERGGVPASLIPPPVTEVSATGSGDVFLASIIHALWTRGRSLEEAVRFALPLAAANAASPGVAEFDLSPFQK